MEPVCGNAAFGGAYGGGDIPFQRIWNGRIGDGVKAQPAPGNVGADGRYGMREPSFNDARASIPCPKRRAGAAAWSRILARAMAVRLCVGALG